jgi:hypothetical protein
MMMMWRTTHRDSSIRRRPLRARFRVETDTAARVAIIGEEPDVPWRDVLESAHVDERLAVAEILSGFAVAEGKLPRIREQAVRSCAAGAIESRRRG